MTIDHSVGHHRQRRSSTTRPTAKACIRTGISRPSTGILQADAYGGFNDLYKAHRRPGPITEAACWSHSRRKFFVLADITKTATARSHKKHASWSPLAHEAVQRIDRIFDAERALNGLGADIRLALRRTHVAPLVTEFENWMRLERAKFSRHNDIAKAMDYMLKRWDAFTRFLDDGRICLTNNAAERALRCVALGRRNWTFCGSDRGGTGSGQRRSTRSSLRQN